METIGGILGQVIATLNIVVLLTAHGLVRWREHRIKQTARRQAEEIKRRQMREAAFRKI